MPQLSFWLSYSFNQVHFCQFRLEILPDFQPDERTDISICRETMSPLIQKQASLSHLNTSVWVCLQSRLFVQSKERLWYYVALTDSLATRAAHPDPDHFIEDVVGPELTQDKFSH